MNKMRRSLSLLNNSSRRVWKEIQGVCSWKLWVGEVGKVRFVQFNCERVVENPVYISGTSPVNVGRHAVEAEHCRGITVKGQCCHSSENKKRREQGFHLAGAIRVLTFR